MQKLSASASANGTIEKVFSVWQKFNIHTVDKYNAVRLLLKKYKQYREIQKKNTRSNRSASQSEIIEQYKQSLHQLFDVSHHDVSDDTKNVYFRQSKLTIASDAGANDTIDQTSNSEESNDELINDDVNDADFVHTETRQSAKVKKTKMKKI